MPPTTTPERPSTDDRCPPTPAHVPEAVETAVESQAALHTAARRRENAPGVGANYRQIVDEYDRRLSDATVDHARCREEMRAFGSYLRRRGVAPEHIVTCVHQALATVPIPGTFSEGRVIGREVIVWAIEGYYGTVEPEPPDAPASPA